MEKKLTISKNKYIRACIKKILMYSLMCLILYIILLILNRGRASFALFKVILILITIGVLYLIIKFSIDYKYYSEENFEIIYDKNLFIYHHFRFTHFFEETLIPMSNYIRISLEANRIDKVVLNRGKIYLYGLMTLEKEAFKLKQKIVKKYVISDYFNETEDLLKIVNSL